MSGGAKNWIWDDTAKEWVKQAGTSGGAMSIKAIVEELNDVEDVNAPSPSDNDSLTWDAATKKWIPEAVTPAGDKATHENGGADEVSVAGLSGELADDQPPKTHASDHENGGGDEVSVAGLSGLLADDQHVLDAEVQAIKIDDFAAPDDNTDLDASAAKHGLMPKADKSKLDGVAASADVTGDNAPQAHKDSHDPQDGSDPLDAAAASEIAGVQAAAEGSAHEVARADHAHQIQHGITDNHLVTVDQADAADDEFARFTANGIESLSVAESITALLGAALPENVGIILDAALSADGKYSGIVEAGTAGATLAFGDIVYLAVADSRYELAKADAAATSKGKIGMCVLAAGSDGDPTVVLLFGKIRADAAFPALTVGAPVFISSATAGDITSTIPAKSTNHVVRIIGQGNTADELYFCPDNDYLEYA